jgi:uncharacterized membrane protein
VLARVPDMASEDQRDGGFGEVAEAAAERMTFFSDAVVAIAITLLAIELPLPEGETSEEIWHGFGEHSFEYLAFGISFLVIANHWTVHHSLFRWVHRVDAPVVQLNFLWLLCIVVNPFLTRIIVEGDLVFLRFSLYAVAQAVQLLALALMIVVLTRRGWLAPDTPRSFTHRGWVRSVVGAAAFLLSVPLFPLLGTWSFAVWALVPFATGHLLRRRRAIEAR